MAESANIRHLLETIAPACPRTLIDTCAASLLEEEKPDAVSRHLTSLQGKLPAHVAPLLFEAIARSAAPLSALENLVRLAEATPEPPWPSTSEHVRALVAVLAGGTYLVEVLLSHPEWLAWVVESASRMWDRRALRDELRRELGDRLAPPDWGVVRRWHRRHLLRIGWADLAGWLDIAEVAAELSALADVTVETVANIWAEVLAERYGQPLQEDGAPATWCVIGLGKLGGNELNFRSDIDLMFLYSADGHSTGGRSEGVTLYEWFTKWAERIIATLTEVSPDGMLYRVDMRLRPDGSSGALVRSMRSYLHYYETRGEVWERQMLIKARPVAGDLALGEALIRALEPFVFPRTLALSPREEIRRIKSRILAHLAAHEASFPTSSQTSRNLKLCRGGLRDIEFIVQCLQLVAGGADRSIRSGNTLEAIRQMAARRVLTEEEAATLTGAYRLYRRIEHRLQMSAGYRTFELPDEPRARSALARSVGYPDTETFMRELERVRSGVMRIYDDVLGPPGPPDEVAFLLELPPGAAQAQAILAPYGFRDPALAHRNLRHLAYGHDEALAPSRPRPAVLRLVPKLLAQLGKSVNPDRGLTNFERILSALGAVESFSDLLSSHPGFLELLVTLCASSQSLTDTVLRDPALIDWMLYSGVLLAERTEEEIGLVLRAGVAGLEDAEEIERAIHAFRKQEVLRVGLRFLLKLDDDDTTCAQLSAIADAVVRMLYHHACADAYAQRGQPLREDGSPAGFAVLALGKFGSREMNFGSDLDLIFMHECEGNTDAGDANVSTFAAAQMILNRLSQPGPYGMLYEVDARLRPEGRSGPLTLSLDGYRHYLHHRASTWERQALTRARLIAGPPEFGRRLMETIHAYVYGPADASLVDETVAMRERMEQESRRRYRTQVNLKTGPGGLVDAEFVAQAGQILFGLEDAALRGRSTLEALARLRETGRLSKEVAEALMTSYRHIRSVQMALRIDDEHAHNVLPDDPWECHVLARRMGMTSADQVREAVERAMERMREAYFRGMEGLRRASAKGSRA